jgi:heptosyltransferase I
VPDRGDAPPGSVLIVMLSALGDAVHVLPVVNALRRAWPDTRISWIIQPVPHALVRGHPAVDEYFVFKRRKGADAWRSYAELRDAFNGRSFDLLIALQVYFKAGLITALAPARMKLGFDRARARDMNWLFTTHRIPPRPVGHVQDQYLEFLEYLGVNPEPVTWRLELSPEELTAQRTFLAPFDKPVCAIVVAGSKPQKNWLPERYARVLESVEHDFGMQPVLVGGPSLLEREAAARIQVAARAHIIHALGDDVRRLVWLLAGSRLVISPDTGPLHIARALDVPVIGLYGWTNPKRYGPYRKYTDLIVDGYALHPDEEYSASMEHRAGGMERVTVAGVIEKIGVALDRYPPRAPGPA